MAGTGAERTRLVILRGNSGSGKSSTAREVQARAGRGVAWVEQDHLRRIVLREHDVPGAVNIGLISDVVRYALDHDYDVLLDGIFKQQRYGEMLNALRRDHRGATFAYYFTVPFEETARRHATRPIAGAFTVEQMREWYVERDVLGWPDERLVAEDASLEQTVERVLRETGIRTGRDTPVPPP